MLKEHLLFTHQAVNGRMLATRGGMDSEVCWISTLPYEADALGQVFCLALWVCLLLISIFHLVGILIVHVYSSGSLTALISSNTTEFRATLHASCITAYLFDSAALISCALFSY